MQPVMRTAASSMLRASQLIFYLDKIDTSAEIVDDGGFWGSYHDYSF